MPNQTIASDAEGLWYGTGTDWVVDGDGGNLYCSSYPEGGGYSFTVDSEIVSGSTINLAHFSTISTTGDQSGTLTLGINIQAADPNTIAAWSSSQNPISATGTASSPHSVGSFNPAISTNYFGAGETQETAITASIQNLVDSYGTLAVGDRINIWTEQTTGGGVMTGTVNNAANELYILWTVGGGTAVPIFRHHYMVQQR